MTIAYPWNPHKVYDRSPNSPFYPTREAAEADKENYIIGLFDNWMDSQVDDVIHMSIQNALRDTTNANTLALARARIPANVDSEDTNRFLIAFQYEKYIGIKHIVNNVATVVPNTASNPTHYRISKGFNEIETIRLWGQRTNQIVEVMKRIEADVPTLAQFEDFIRDMAMIEIGEKIGVQINTTTTPVILSIQNPQGIPTFHTMPPGKKLSVCRLNGIWNRGGATEDNTGNVGITGKNGASFVTTYSGADYNSRTKNADILLNKGQTSSLTFADMKHEITSRIIAWPTIKNRIDSQVFRRNTNNSVSLVDVFGGDRLTITETSTGTVSATINEAQTSVSINPGDRGGRLTLTATNDSGSVNFIFSVVASQS